jgi:hypothetical protein
MDVGVKEIHFTFYLLYEYVQYVDSQHTAIVHTHCVAS